MLRMDASGERERSPDDPLADPVGPAGAAGARAGGVGGAAAHRSGQPAAPAALLGRERNAGRTAAPSDRAGGDRDHGGGGRRRLRYRRTARRHARHRHRRERVSGRDLQADAVLRVQRAEVDLPAPVHPRVRHRISPEGRLRRLHHLVRGADERHGGGGIGARRPHHGGALLRRHAGPDPVARLRAEHAAAAAGDAAHLHDLQLHGRDDRRDVRLAHGDRTPDRQLGRELPDAAAVRRRDPAGDSGHPVQRVRFAGWRLDAARGEPEGRPRPGRYPGDRGHARRSRLRRPRRRRSGANGHLAQRRRRPLRGDRRPERLRQDLAVDDDGRPAPPDGRRRSAAMGGRSPIRTRSASASFSRRRACFPGSPRSATSSSRSACAERRARSAGAAPRPC